MAPGSTGVQAGTDEPVRTRLPIAFALTLLPTLGFLTGTGSAEPAAAQPSGRSVTVELASGRRFTGQVDSHTNRSQLWLRYGVESGFLLRPVDWSRVVRIQLAGEVFTGQEFQHAVSAVRQAFPDDSQAGDARSEIILGPPPNYPIPQAAPRDAEAGSRHAAQVRSLAAEARLANWDGDVEADGLVVEIRPLDGQGATVPVRGMLEVNLMAERVGVVKRAQPFARLGRWTQQVRPADFGAYGAVYRLPFGSIHPEFDLRWSPYGAAHVRLSVPGQGVFERTDSAVRIRSYSAVRDQLEQATGRRFFELERTGRGDR